MTSAENSVLKPPNLKIFWGRIPPDLPKRLVPSALAIMPAPVTKNLATALYNKLFGQFLLPFDKIERDNKAEKYHYTFSFLRSLQQ